MQKEFTSRCPALYERALYGVKQAIRPADAVPLAGHEVRIVRRGRCENLD